VTAVNLRRRQYAHREESQSYCSRELLTFNFRHGYDPPSPLDGFHRQRN